MITIGGTIRRSRIANSFIETVLNCELGTFAIHDDRLKSLPCGEHDGLFEIARIDQHLTTLSACTVQFQIVATLNRIAFQSVSQNISENSMDNVSNTPDSQQELSLPLALEDDSQKQVPVEISRDSIQTEAAQSSDVKDAELFGELWPLSDEVKLDVTLSRRQQSLQAERLSILGYQCKPETQVWHKQRV